MKPILIIKTGSTIPHIASHHGDFDRWFSSAMGLAETPEATVVVEAQHSDLPHYERFSGIIVTGSPAMVSQRESWSERTASWLLPAHQSEMPILGVCYGHQLIAHALGGEVGPNPNGRHIGTAKLNLSRAGLNDPLLQSLAAEPYAQVTHQESVLRIPAASTILASVEQDPHHAIHYGNQTWGFQFHPEFSDEITRLYINERRQDINNEGLDAQALEREVRATPVAGSLLHQFRLICEQFAAIQTQQTINQTAHKPQDSLAQDVGGV